MDAGTVDTRPIDTLPIEPDMEAMAPAGLQDKLPAGIDAADLMKLIEQLVEDALERAGVGESGAPDGSGGAGDGGGELPPAAEEALAEGDIAAFVAAMVADRLQAAGVDPGSIDLSGGAGAPGGAGPGGPGGPGGTGGDGMLDGDAIERFLDENGMPDQAAVHAYLSNPDMNVLRGTPVAGNPGLGVN